MKVLISAIIPVYNTEEYLEKCIDSLRKQTLKDIEIIFINDGSSDDSLRVLRQYEKLDERIIVIDKKNSGPSATRNEGIDIARGEYLSFIDSDDWIDKCMFEEMYKVAKEGNSDVVICDMKAVNKNEETYISGLHYPIRNLSERSMKKIIFKELLSNSQFNSMANKIFKASIIKENNIRLDKDIYYAEDWLFNVEFFKKSIKVSYVNKAFYYYRRGHESSSSSYNDDTFEKAGIWIYKMRKQYANELNMDQYLGVDELFNVITHCIISEFKRNDLTLSSRIKKINKIISAKESKEVVDNMEKSKLSLKEKFLLYSIKNKKIINLYIYFWISKLKNGINDKNLMIKMKNA